MYKITTERVADKEVCCHLKPSSTCVPTGLAPQTFEEFFSWGKKGIGVCQCHQAAALSSRSTAWMRSRTTHLSSLSFASPDWKLLWEPQGEQPASSCEMVATSGRLSFGEMQLWKKYKPSLEGAFLRMEWVFFMQGTTWGRGEEFEDIWKGWFCRNAVPHTGLGNCWGRSLRRRKHCGQRLSWKSD